MLCSKIEPCRHCTLTYSFKKKFATHGAQCPVTRLFIAAKNNDAKNVSKLLAARINSDALFEMDESDDGGSFALLAAAKQGHVDIVKLLAGAYASMHMRSPRDHVTPLHMAASLGHASIVEMLIAKGAETSVRAKFGITPLIAAVIGGHANVVAVLVASGVNIDEPIPPGDCNLEAHTALHIATQAEGSNYQEIVELLIRGNFKTHARRKTYM
jgi:ankyrin repeat protein